MFLAVTSMAAEDEVNNLLGKLKAAAGNAAGPLSSQIGSADVLALMKQYGTGVSPIRSDKGFGETARLVRNTVGAHIEAPNSAAWILSRENTDRTTAALCESQLVGNGIVMLGALVATREKLEAHAVRLAEPGRGS